jgi:ATP-binding cassette, subfamily C, bacterial
MCARRRPVHRRARGEEARNGLASRIIGGELGLREIVRSVIAFDRRKVFVALLLMSSVGMIEGGAVLLLIPLLRVAGLDMPRGSLGRLNAPLRWLAPIGGVTPKVMIVLAAYAMVGTLEASLIRAQALFESRFVQEYSHSLRARLYNAIAGADWLTLTRIRSSNFTFAITIAVDRVGTTAHQILSVASIGAVALVYIVLSLLVAPAMALTILAAAAVLLVLQHNGTISIAVPGEEVDASTNEFYASAAEHFGGLKTAKSYGAEDRHLAMFLKASDRVSEALLALIRSHAGLQWIQSVGSVVALCGLLFTAIAVFHLPTASILLLLFLFSRLVPRLLTIQRTFQQVLAGLPAFRTVASLIDICEHSGRALSPAQETITAGNIDLERVDFAYSPDAATPQLAHISLSIPFGRITAIVGASGSGKSTVADLVLGLLVPQGGKLTVAGRELTVDYIASWRSRLGYVAQDTFLFNETVRANLSWANPEATEQEMLKALADAAADEFVAALPRGLDTVVGERGARLSGGERQRLSLARALIRNPAYLVLDEATNALDSENEARIYQAIQRLRGKMTILVITHRLSTIRFADLIHVMDNGQVSESGTWESLTQNLNSRFRQLYVAQRWPR